MSAYSKQSGTWTPVKTIYGKTGGVWTLVKRAFVNVNGTWKQFLGGNSLEIYSLGLQQTFYPSADKGLWANGAVEFVAARSYNVVTFDQFGNIATSASFDLFGDGVNYANAGSSTQNMIAALGAITAGTPYMIFTYDEPSTNAAQIKSAMTALMGGNTSILTSSMAYRGAYIAFGQAGAAPVVEAYCGTFQNSVSNGSASTPQTDEGCVDAVMHYTFRIYNGQIVNVNRLAIGGTVISSPYATGAPTIADLA